MRFNFFRKPARKAALRLPDFLIIGAQKSGTSWLHHCLRQNKNIYMPADKDYEVDFLEAGELARYAQRFADCPADQLAGDACAAWFWTKRGNDPVTGEPRNVVSDIHQAFGNQIKMIVLARNPVQRAISGFLHHIAFQTHSPGVPISQADPALGVVALSRYGFHLKNWLEIYQPDNLLVLPSPGEAEGREILERASRFLGLPVDQTPEDLTRTVMPGLKKVQDEDGVWVDMEAAPLQELARHNPYPTREIDGKPFALLINKKDIENIHAELRDDTQLFLDLTRANGWCHRAFDQWLGP